MKDLLYECSKNTGYDERTVEQVVNCFMNIIAARLYEGCAVDLGENFGTFFVKERTGYKTENAVGVSESGRYQVIFRTGRNLNCRLSIKEVDNCVPSGGLLELLQMKVGCMYLSDLHLPFNLFLVQSILEKIEPDSYELREWKDTVCYLTGQEVNFESQRDAAEYLMNWNH